MGALNPQVFIVTGAAGYLGREIVSSALARGHRVKAVVRPGCDVGRLPWANNASVELIEIDLAAASAAGLLASTMAECDAGTAVVIHAAASFSGDDVAQQVQTIEPTRSLLTAMQQASLHRLVLVSSLSVYGYLAMPEGSQLDETTPAEHYVGQRDAYCRAKLAQEAMALQAAQCRGLVVTVLRAGAIYGPDHFWSARLGVMINRLGLLVGHAARLPLIFVRDCALAAVLAAERADVPSDVYTVADARGNVGSFEIINVVGDHQPTQREYLRWLRRHAGVAPRYTLSVPWGIARRLVGMLALIDWVSDGWGPKLPALLRQASLHARFKPLRYSNCRLHDRLGWKASARVEEVILQSGKRS